VCRLLASCYLQEDYYDLVDVDSFGSDTSFLPAAIDAVKYGGMLYLTSTDGFCSAGAARQVVLTWHDTANILAAAAWCPVGSQWPSSALHSNTSVGVICMLQLDFTCPNSPHVHLSTRRGQAILPLPLSLLLWLSLSLLYL